MNQRPAINLLQDVAEHLGWNQPETIEGELDNYTRKLVRTLNRVLRAMQGLDEWWFLRKEGRIVTDAPYKVGLVEVTNGSTTVTGIDDPNTTASDPPVWTSDMEGRAFAVDGVNYNYRITRVVDSTTLELDLAYQGDTATGTNALSYIIAQDRYDLPTDFDRPVGDWTNFFKVSGMLTMVPMDPNSLLDVRRARGRFMLLSEPRRFTLFGTDDQQEHRRVVLDPFPDQSRVLEFPYQMNHPEIETDADRILFPLRHEEVIIESMLYLLRRDIHDDGNAQLMLIDFLRARTEAASRVELGQPHMQITPSTNRRFAERARWGRGSRRIDYGDRFDIISLHPLDRR